MDYNALKNYRNNFNHFAKATGVVLDEVREGYARCELQLKPEHFNVIKSVHGGALYTLMDTTGGATAASYGVPVTTLNSNIVFMNAVREPIKLYGLGRCIKHGRKISVIDVKITDDTGLIYAQGTFTFFTLEHFGNE